MLLYSLTETRARQLFYQGCAITGSQNSTSITNVYSIKPILNGLC